MVQCVNDVDTYIIYINSNGLCIVDDRSFSLYYHQSLLLFVQRLYLRVKKINIFFINILRFYLILWFCP